MQAINLLPVDLTQVGRRGPSVPVFAAGAVPFLSLSLIIAGYAQAHSAVSARRADLTAVQSRIAALSPATLGSSADADLVSQRMARRAALDAVLKIRYPLDTTLSDFARVLPAGVWLTALNLHAPSESDPTLETADGFTITGNTYSERSVAMLLERLELLPGLSHVTLENTTSSGGAGSRPIVQFQITAALGPASEPAAS